MRAYRLSDGARRSALDIDTKASGNARPMGLWSDGGVLWASDEQDDRLYAYAVPVQRDTDGPWAAVATLGAEAVSYTVTGLSASNATASTVDLSWMLPEQPAGVTPGAVSVQRETGGSWTTVATRAADAVTYTVTGVAAGTTYRFRIRVATGAGDADSAPMTAATQAVPESPVAGFVLVDGDDATDLGALSGGDELATGLGALEIRADVRAGEGVGSVRLELGGAKTVSRTENLAPYELFGGRGGEEFGAGSYALTVTQYSERGLGGAAGVAASVSFTVAAPSPSAVVDGATLTLGWKAPRDTFAAPHGSDLVVRVDGGLRPMSSASVSGNRALLRLSSPLGPGQAVRVDHLGSSMHPRADARGVEVGAWTDLPAENVTRRAGATVVWAAAGGREATAGRRGGPRWPSAAMSAKSLSLASAGLADGDIGRLAGLTGVERLELSGNALTDFAPLADRRGWRAWICPATAYRICGRCRG